LLETRSANSDETHLAVTLLIMAAAGASQVTHAAPAAAIILSIFSRYPGIGGHDGQVAPMHAVTLRQTRVGATGR
jgi:hypothetical protein